LLAQNNVFPYLVSVYNNMIKDVIYIVTIILIFSADLHAQNTRIVLGPDEVAMNQAFTITVEVQNDRLRGSLDFPEIPGFQQTGTSSSSSTNIINGQYSFSQSITQNYLPMKEGVFTLRPFSMTVNGETVQSPGKTIRVGPPRQQQQRRGYDPFADPFEDFFDRRAPQEFVDIKEDAFLALTVDKEEVYVGEGFTTTLGFYVAETNRADLSFYETGQQLAEIKKKITPSNCWEENFNIERLNREYVTINNKRYGRYKIFQATFYPFNQQDINFPEVSLKMIKYKVAKNPSFFGRNRKEDFKTFYSTPKTVKVKALPPHPLRETVPVGNYALRDDISETALQTGQSFNYEFSVVGEGNISAIEKPAVASDNDFEFYPPNIQQNITRMNGKVKGTKSFQYYGIPNEPGNYNVGDFIYMVYFNPDQEQYDTLRSDIDIQVVGESKKNVYISSNDLGTFYDIIELERNNLTKVGSEKTIKIAANVLILLLFLLTLFLMIKN